MKVANQSFRMTFWHMMMHQYTNSGYKRFSDSGHINPINTENLNLPRHLDLENSKPIFSQGTSAYDDIKLNVDAKQSVVQMK